MKQAVEKQNEAKDDYEILCDKFDEEKLEPKYKNFLAKYIENYFNFNAVSWGDLSREFEVSIAFNKFSDGAVPFTGVSERK